eukprot:NODE_925_length_3060_cov_0.339412.p2 type:complete len:156 gc:universal NODE_925_length_3060_cov_0.339412:818-1285(+)
MSKMDEKVPSWDQLHECELLEHIVMETLRLHSPLLNVARKATKGLKFKDMYFPKGTVFMLGIDARHHDEHLFSNPNEFDPSRWTNPNTESYSFMPFYTGFRGCIGKNLAMLELKTVLAVLICKMEFKMKDPSVGVQYTISQRPINLKMSMQPVEE